MDVIGKMHGQMHVEACQYCHSLYYTRGVGRTDGEEAERFWAEANQVAGSTKQMNPGHRCDTLDDVINDWNKTKLLQHGTFWYEMLSCLTDDSHVGMMIEKKLPSTRKRADNLGLKFDATDATLRARYSDSVVDKWVQRGTEYVRDRSGEVDSPFKSKNAGIFIKLVVLTVALINCQHCLLRIN